MERSNRGIWGSEAGGSERTEARLSSHMEDGGEMEDSGGRMAHRCYLGTSEIGNISCT